MQELTYDYHIAVGQVLDSDENIKKKECFVVIQTALSDYVESRRYKPLSATSSPSYNGGSSGLAKESTRTGHLLSIQFVLEYLILGKLLGTIFKLLIL